MPEEFHQSMSDYEARSWKAMLEQARRREARRQIVPEKLRSLADGTVERVQELLEDHERLRNITEAMGKPLEGLNSLLTDVGGSTVSRKRLVRRAARRGAAVTSLADIRDLDLEVPDRLLGRRGLFYTAGMGVEGAATSLAVTGGVVASTVSGGTTFAIAAGAMGVDIVANLTVSARLVSEIAMTYGYDVDTPDERLYVLGVLSYATAGTAAGKSASLAQLSRLTQQMMRHPTWAKLNGQLLVQVTQQVFKVLGFRLTQQKLAQVIPVVGVVANAGLNMANTRRLSSRAQHAYRLRFLTEKYDLDPASWLGTVETADEDTDELAIDLEEIIEELDEDGGIDAAGRTGAPSR